VENSGWASAGYYSGASSVDGWHRFRRCHKKI
jgi:hypothetical protein